MSKNKKQYNLADTGIDTEKKQKLDEVQQKKTQILTDYKNAVNVLLRLTVASLNDLDTLTTWQELEEYTRQALDEFYNLCR